MKTVLSILALGGGASAFVSQTTSRPASSALPATMAEIESLPGVSVEAGKKVFDPAGLAQWAPADFLRKAELSNGRAAMLATVGWLWPTLAGTFDSDDVTTSDPIEAIFQADPQWWAQWVLFCGVIEGIKYRAELEGKSYTGDGPAAIDYLNLWDKLSADEKEDMRLKELKNGRLAMIGMAGFFANHFIPGSVPGLPEAWS